MAKFLLFLVCICSFGILSCVPVTPDVEAGQIAIDWKDPLSRKIADFANAATVDSLYQYFHKSQATYRYLALRSFASLQDSNAIDSIATLLADPVMEIRRMAAYSLGQTRNSKADSILVRAFAKADTLGKNTPFHTALLEAIGKTSSLSTFKKLVAVQTYTVKDTALMEGLARGIYQFMLRKMELPAGQERMLEFATKSGYNTLTKEFAASYLNRATDYDASPDVFRIIASLDSEKDAFTRINLIQAISKTSLDTIYPWIESHIGTETDLKVKIALVSSLIHFDPSHYQVLIANLVKDKNEYIANAAAEVILQNGNEVDALNYFDMASDSLAWPVKYKLLAAANKFTPYSEEETRVTINNALSLEFLKRTDPYRKAAIIQALSEDVSNYIFIWENGVRSNHPTIKTASMHQLGRILANPKLASVYKSTLGQVRKNIAAFVLQGIISGDVGLISEGSLILSNPDLYLKSYATDTITINALEKAFKKLRYPADLEAAIDFSKCLNYLTGREYPIDYKAKAKPIAWNVFSGLEDSSKVLIKTNKGDIQLKLLTRDCPATVSSFLELIQKRYFIQKRFHRVVPNFVIQGGCNRGDGYGSLDFNLRSELSKSEFNEAGMIGMASVGKDTESQQFFITQGPAIHLNGKYSLFAKVISGQEIVDQIQIGDIIQEIKFYP
ncbi:MAG: peptidylprolyl isomerase [Saprospiraceae bacterium]